MKNILYFIIFLFLCTIFFACNSVDKEKENLQARIDSLEAVNTSQASQLKEISDFMSIASEGLDSIAAQEELLLGNNKGMEGHRMTKEELKANLDAFATLLERQHRRIAQLEDSLTSRGGNMESLRQIITYLNRQLEEKNHVIATLQSSLNNKNVDIQRLNTQVSTLTASNEKLAEEVNRQGEALVTQSTIINECFVKIGTKKELQQVGVLSGTGFLSKKKLDVANFEHAGFMRVDIRNYVEVDIPAKKIQILTAMPPSSYSITNDGNNSKLLITNPTLFWSVSNYLVILKK